ncbi:hypothetical protein [Bacillus sp. Hm123]|uniref:hypothetical protein n=1 Tax=Bacillus sp. Hm123 TaxID=3450745 RepID=UPI003F43E738
MSKTDDHLFRELKMLQGEEILVITQATQLDLLGQVFRPIFCGTVADVQLGHLTLSPVIIKMVNAPFHQFPFPLNIPLERVAAFTTEVPCDKVFPLI